MTEINDESTQDKLIVEKTHTNEPLAEIKNNFFIFKICDG